jgi:putative Mg2+ transporter-C (MgtC) family protein
MLVSLGAATFTALGKGLSGVDEGNDDPTRVIQGIATGIGFLGAGQILQNKDRIRGLTTAAGIWLVGAVGVACGVGLYTIAVTAVVLGLTTLSIVRRIEEKLTS